MSTYDFTEKPKRTVPLEQADLGTRLIALIIDNIILVFIGGILVRGELGWGLSFILGAAYQWYFLTQQNGQTIGKKLMNIRVVKANGAPLTAADAILRYAGYYLNSIIFGIGWIWAAFDADKQGWHDKLASTYVVRA
jgi:uncharacterized RDD family membrane protein YckC